MGGGETAHHWVRRFPAQGLADGGPLGTPRDRDAQATAEILTVATAQPRDSEQPPLYGFPPVAL